jgi:hypothetical protein
MTMIIETPEQFRLYTLLRLKAALKLECAGMRHSKGHSAYGIAKKSFGFKGNRVKVLEQLTDYINAEYANDN